jgi:hypothetical protein
LRRDYELFMMNPSDQAPEGRNSYTGAVGMKKRAKYREIEPPQKWFKTLITKLCLFYLGIGIETAYNNVPEVKADMDTLPDPFAFAISVLNGPSMLILKKGGKVEFIGEKEAYHVDLEMVFKNIEFAFLAMTFRLSTPELVYHNRQLVRGDLNQMMMMIRVLNAAETVLFPNLLLRFYLKQVPRLTLATAINRLKAHSFALARMWV